MLAVLVDHLDQIVTEVRVDHNERGVAVDVGLEGMAVRYVFD